MTNEQLNIICAEAEGWKCVQKVYDGYIENGLISVRDVFLNGAIVGVMPINFQKGFIGDRPYHYHAIPNYGEDLNAMHEVEKVLKYEPDYILHLVQLLDVPDGRGDWDDEELWASVVMATATQRREAFVRTIGKWEEE